MSKSERVVLNFSRTHIAQRRIRCCFVTQTQSSVCHERCHSRRNCPRQVRGRGPRCRSCTSAFAWVIESTVSIEVNPSTQGRAGRDSRQRNRCGKCRTSCSDTYRSRKCRCSIVGGNRRSKCNRIRITRWVQSVGLIGSDDGSHFQSTHSVRRLICRVINRGSQSVVVVKAHN